MEHVPNSRNKSKKWGRDYMSKTGEDHDGKSIETTEPSSWELMDSRTAAVESAPD